MSEYSGGNSVSWAFRGGMWSSVAEKDGIHRWCFDDLALVPYLLFNSIALGLESDSTALGLNCGARHLALPFVQFNNTGTGIGFYSAGAWLWC